MSQPVCRLCGARTEAEQRVCDQWRCPQLERLRSEELRADWQEVDSHASWLEACAAMRRKLGGEQP